MTIADVHEDQYTDGEPIDHKLVSITFRKNNQDDQTKRSNYKLYNDKKELAINAYSKLKVYLSMLRTLHPRLPADSLLFPRIVRAKIELSGYNIRLSPLP